MTTSERDALKQLEHAGAILGGAGQQPGPGAPARVRAHAVLGRILLHLCNLLIAAGALAAYEHFRVTGASGAALASLL
ncbi:MAG TPA: hypothetical protein VHE11_16440, partial [Steroidobacteraceae bacterium]|nr:hypothetical protein [Steroidobacteraceae bacterium]